MSEKITSSNLDSVIQKNREIREEIDRFSVLVRSNSALMEADSVPQLGLFILQKWGGILFPVEDPYWSGGIFVKDGRMVPIINTALPRVNQYFTAWHEVYHMLFDRVSFDHLIGADNTMEERKAECFAASMLLSGLTRYYENLHDMDFISKIFYCMSMFQAPYKSVMISLYEFADQNNNHELMKLVKDNFNRQFYDLPKTFRLLVLDDNLVRPSYVVNTNSLRGKIREQIKNKPDLSYHRSNEAQLDQILEELELLVVNSYA